MYHPAWIQIFFYVEFLFSFLVELGFDTGLQACQVLLLEPHLQSILLWLFEIWKSIPLLAQNLYPPCLSLLRS
jgi:hypothetical protein